MHGGCGMWGLLATGLLGEVTSIQYYYGPSAIAGGFYRRGQMLACQIVGILAIGGWTAFMMASCFSALKAAGRLRVNAAEEAVGMDESTTAAARIRNSTCRTTTAPTSRRRRAPRNRSGPRRC